MIKLGLLLAFFTVVSILQVSIFRKRNLTKEIWGYAVLMTAVAVISGLQLLGLPHSSPLTPFEALFEPFGKLLLGS